jgi:hypothetical protein
MQRTLFIAGAVLVIAGLLWPWLSRLPLGSLPGDIRIQRPGFTFFFPLGTSVLLSVLLTAVLAVIAWLSRR